MTCLMSVKLSSAYNCLCSGNSQRLYFTARRFKRDCRKHHSSRDNDKKNEAGTIRRKPPGSSANSSSELLTDLKEIVEYEYARNLRVYRKRHALHETDPRRVKIFRATACLHNKR